MGDKNFDHDAVEQEIKKKRESILNELTDSSPSDSPEETETPKNFSDYFSDAPQSSDTENQDTGFSETQGVIPPEAVDLHNEIVQPAPPPLQETINTPKAEEHHPAENYTHPEYVQEPKPKRTGLIKVLWILFFVFIIMLFVSAVIIYKVFFSPKETQTTENVQQPGAKQNETGKQPELQGVSKNSMGWTDEKNRVIYVSVKENKFAIQESSWNSENKAADRLRQIDALNIARLKGNVVKEEVSGKGTWYRVRLGEFASLEEAQSKAIELRKKI